MRPRVHGSVSARRERGARSSGAPPVGAVSEDLLNWSTASFHTLAGSVPALPGAGGVHKRERTLGGANRIEGVILYYYLNPHTTTTTTTTRYK